MFQKNGQINMENVEQSHTPEMHLLGAKISTGVLVIYSFKNCYSSGRDFDLSFWMNLNEFLMFD